MCEMPDDAFGWDYHVIIAEQELHEALNNMPMDHPKYRAVLDLYQSIEELIGGE